jgi:hypothetical protein
VSIFTRKDGAEGQREHRLELAAEFERRRLADEQRAAEAAAATRGLTSEETEALAKARYAAAQEMRRQKAEEIAALRETLAQVQGIGSTAEINRDIALAARDLEAAVDAQVRINGAHALAEHIDQQGQRRFDSSWRTSR